MLKLNQPPGEGHYALLFPNQPIPTWALDNMRLLKTHEYTLSAQRLEVVPLAQVVGTCHTAYGGLARWIDIITSGQNSHWFELDEWPGILTAKTDEIAFVRVAGTDEYYILGEGNHRVTAFKLAGRPTMTSLVAVAHYNEAYDDPTYTAQPIRPANLYY